MIHSFRRNPWRGGIYHLGLILVTFSSFNWGFLKLTGVDIAGRIFDGFVIPAEGTAILLCVSSIAVLWSNWVD